MAQSREASTSRSWVDELVAELEAEEAYEALRSPSLQPPRFRERPVAALLRAMGIDRSARKRRAWLYTERVVRPVCLLEPKLRAMSDDQLRAQTPKLRAQLAAGATLEQLLPEAFATVREVSRRVRGLRHYDTQLIGGAVLHEGNVAEMGTGEGKTLVATLAAYLNALPQKGCVFVVTVNEYLVARDAALMGRLYRALGLTCGCVLSGMSIEERVSDAGYGADVTYVTALELGFDYLRDNSAMFPGELRQLRPFWFAIVDEVDSILIDEARNPMLLAKPYKAPSSRFEEANKIAQQLSNGVHYTVNLRERNVLLSDEGISAAEQLLKVNDLFAGADSWAGKVTDAVTAKELYTRDTHYLVRGKEVVIIDIATGRTRKESRWAENLHQAIEAKEGLEVQAEQQTVATITYQSFFKLFPKLSGMSGTARNEVAELFETYGMDVVSVPPNRPLVRDDLPFTVVMTEEQKWHYVAVLVSYYHQHGTPVMVGTSSVHLSELLSERLARVVWQAPGGAKRLGIPHNLLNARPDSVAREAAIVAQAGRMHAVTITTNMAGRGTDILLGGNPLGLARTVLVDRLFDAFGLKAPPPLGSLGQPPELQGAVATALDRAEQAARFCREEKKEQFSVEKVQALLDAALERADSGKPDASDGGSVLEDSLAFAAHWVLCGCKAQCEKEAQLVRDMGGLQVIGTSFSESGRVDDQLRGRAGRQGDPGGSLFVISTEDSVFAMFRDIPMVMYCLQLLHELKMSSWISRVMKPAIEEVQKAFTDTQRTERLNTARYDAVLHVHRQVVLGLRRRVLLDTPAQRRARFFRFFEEMVDEALETWHFNVITPPSKWAVGRLLHLCRRVTATFTTMDGKQQAMINFLPGVTSEELTQALEYGGELPLGRTLPPVNAHPLSLVFALASESGVSVEDQALTQADYDDAAKAAAAAAEVLKLRVEQRVLATPLSLVPLAGYGAHKARLRAFLLEYVELMYDDRVERASLRGMPEWYFHDIGLNTALAFIDDEWSQHLDTMHVTRYSSMLTSYAVCDPLVDYQTRGKAELEVLLRRIRRRCINSLFAACDPQKWRSPAEMKSDEAARAYRDYLDLIVQRVPDYEPQKVYDVLYIFRFLVWLAPCVHGFMLNYPKAKEEAERAQSSSATPQAAAAVVAAAAAAAAACAAALAGGNAATTLARDDVRG